MSCKSSLPISMKLSFLVLIMLFMVLWLTTSEAKPARVRLQHKKHPKVCGLTKVGALCNPQSRKFKKCCDRGLTCRLTPVHEISFTRKGKYQKIKSWVNTCQYPKPEEQEKVEEEDMSNFH